MLCGFSLCHPAFLSNAWKWHQPWSFKITLKIKITLWITCNKRCERKSRSKHSQVLKIKGIGRIMGGAVWKRSLVGIIRSFCVCIVLLWHIVLLLKFLSCSVVVSLMIDHTALCEFCWNVAIYKLEKDFLKQSPSRPLIVFTVRIKERNC